MTRHTLCAALAAIALATAAAPALATDLPPIDATLEGRVLAYDGDTLFAADVTVTVDNRSPGTWTGRIRLWGISTPEMRTWPWGPWARGVIDEVLLAAGDRVRCVVRDHHDNRVVGQCVAWLDGRPVDLGEDLVRRGAATDYRLFSAGRYYDAEAEARRHGRGVWRGAPWLRPVETAVDPQAARDAANRAANPGALWGPPD